MYAASSHEHLERERARAAKARQAQRGIVRPQPPTFRGGGLAVQSETSPEWMLSGPSETGKTWATLWKLDTFMRATPRGQFALVRKTQATINSTVLVTYRRIQELRKALGDTPAHEFGGNDPRWYDYENGARLWIGGMDNPSKILSGERDGIYVNQAEELTQADWETLSTRATGRGAVTDTPMLFGDCNPGPEDHWILRRKAAGRLVFYESKHEDNPTLFDEHGTITEQGKRTLATLDALTGARKQRLRYGRWVGAEGQYFTAWDEAVHVCNPFALPSDWPLWGALDWGFAHPTAFGLYTMGTDGIVYKIGEHVQHKWLVPQHADAIKELVWSFRITWDRIRTIVAGQDVFADRGDSRGKTIAEQFHDAGIDLIPAQTARITGAQVMLKRLGNADAHLPVTFRVFNTCRRTIATIPAMVHDPMRPEDVLKVNADADGTGGDDCYDESRYALMEAETFNGWGADALRKLSSGKRV